MLRAVLISLAVTICTACGVLAPRGSSAPETNPELPPNPGGNGSIGNSPLTKSRASMDQASLRVTHVAALVDQTRLIVNGWTGSDAELSAARAALAVQQPDSALQHAEEAAAGADQVLSDHYTRLASAELAKTYTLTGLDDAQVEQLRAAEETLVAGNSRLAYGRLRTLNRELERRTKTYAVKPGDSLWTISGKPEVYDNPHLWPLIWDENRGTLPNPNKLRGGQVLRLRPHPTTDEVVRAVDEARQKKAAPRETVTPDIGEIREAD